MISFHHSKYATHSILSLMFLFFMTIACLWILRPFILSLVWAGIVVVSTWPLLLFLQKILFNCRALAMLIIMIFLILVFIIPIVILINSLTNTSIQIIHLITRNEINIPDPIWLKTIPIIGVKLYNTWHNLIDMSGSAIMAKIHPYIGSTTTWFVDQAAYVGRFIIHCALMLIFSILLYWRGEQVALSIRHFANRVAGARGDAVVLLTAQAVRAVALGVVITALIQSILGGIGLAISGIPYVTLFTVIMMMTCLVQLGPMLVLIPCIIWLYWKGDNTWSIVLTIWSCIVGTMDNIIRPVLIKIGADLPMILILLGIIGGLIAFGLIGLSIGPVLLAVTWRLFSTWVHEIPPPEINSDIVLHELKILNNKNKQ